MKVIRVVFCPDVRHTVFTRRHCAGFAPLLQRPTFNGNLIVFSYAGDLWTVDRRAVIALG